MNIPIAKYLRLLPYLQTIFAIITDVEATFGPGNGTQKKQAAVKALTDILQVAEPLLADKNPEFGAELSAVIDEIVSLLNKWAATLKEPPAVVPPTPPIVPVTPPAVVDPTAVEYATSGEAIAHATQTDPNVIERADGKFGVWPQAMLPTGAKIVYTLPPPAAVDAANAVGTFSDESGLPEATVSNVTP